MRMRLRTVTIVLILLTNLLPAYAQNSAEQPWPGNGGTVTGQVKDSTGGVIPNAAVTLTNSSGASQTVQSQADGTYLFYGVQPGTYTVSATFKGLTQDGLVAVQLN